MAASIGAKGATMGQLKRAFPSYKQPSVVTFGTGSIKALLECEDLAETAFFLSGQVQVRQIVASSLHKYGQTLDAGQVMTKPAGEPTYAMVQAGAAFLRRHPWQRIVGIGGGSVLDWCRLAWAASQDMLSLDDGKTECTRDSSGPARILARADNLWHGGGSSKRGGIQCQRQKTAGGLANLYRRSGYSGRAVPPTCQPGQPGLCPL